MKLKQLVTVNIEQLKNNNVQFKILILPKCASVITSDRTL